MELGRDRRTVTAALDGVEPDGRAGRYDGWTVATAVRAPAGDTDHLVAAMLDRLSFARRPKLPELSIEEFARASRYPPATILRLLPAGMPYLAEGDWQTGKGFVLCFTWSVDWPVTMEPRVRAAGPEAMRAFGLARE